MWEERRSEEKRERPREKKGLKGTRWPEERRVRQINPIANSRGDVGRRRRKIAGKRQGNDDL